MLGLADSDQVSRAPLRHDALQYALQLSNRYSRIRREPLAAAAQRCSIGVESGEKTVPCYAKNESRNQGRKPLHPCQIHEQPNARHYPNARFTAKSNM